jgi:hypothetical protein
MPQNANLIAMDNAGVIVSDLATTVAVTAERHKWQAIADRMYIEPLGSAVN